MRADLWGSTEGELVAEAQLVGAEAVVVRGAWRQAGEQSSVEDSWVKPTLLHLHPHALSMIVRWS